MRTFRPVRQMAAPVGRHITLFGRDRQVAAPGAKSAVFDCILLVAVTFVGDTKKQPLVVRAMMLSPWAESVV